MLINNRYKDKLLRLKGEEQINNEHWASVLSGGLERDQVQIMIKVTVIDSKQVTTAAQSSAALCVIISILMPVLRSQPLEILRGARSHKAATTGCTLQWE